MDSTVQAVTKSFGGVSIVMSLGITVIGILIPKIIELAFAKKQLIEIDEKQVALFATVATFSKDETQATVARAAALGLLVVAFDQTAAAQKELNFTSARLTEANRVMREDIGKTVRVLESVGDGPPIYRDLAVTAEFAAGKLKDAALAHEANQKAVQKQIEPLIAYRNVTGQSVEATIQLARGLGNTEEQLNLIRQALDEDTNKMTKFAEALMKAAHETRNLTDAERELMIARGLAKSPGFESRATAEDFGKLASDLSVNLEALKNQSATFRESVLNQSGPLKELQTHLREITLTQAGYRAELAKLPENVQHALAELDVISKGMKNFADHSKEAERAAKALAKTTAELASQQRISAIETQIAVAQDAGDYERLYTLKNDLITEHYSLKTIMLMNDKQATEKNLAALAFMEMDAHKRLGIEQKRDNEERIKENDRRLKVFADGERALAGEIFKIREKLLADTQKSNVLWWKQQNRLQIEQLNEATREMQQLGRRLGIDTRGSLVTDSDIATVLRYKQRMDALHVTLRILDGDFVKDQRAARQFDSALRILEATSKKGMLGGLRESLRAVRDALLDVNALTDVFANVLESAFSRIGQSGTSFLRSFAASLISGISQIVAGVLSQVGTMMIGKGIADVAFGIALNANPFFPGGGTALIAAGKHEIAVGAGLKLLGAAVSGLGQAAASVVQGGGREASSGGSSAVAGGRPTATPTGRSGPTPVVVDLSGNSSNRSVPVAGRSVTNNYYSVHLLSDDETKRYWDDQFKKKAKEQGVLTTSSIKDQHNGNLKQAVGVRKAS